MNFYEFSKFIIQYQDNFPDTKRYPTSISLDSSIWEGIKSLLKYTSQFNYEHSIGIYDVDREIITTPPTKGSKTDVITRHQINLKYVPKTKDFFEKQIYINGKLAKKSSIKVTDTPKDPKIISLFNTHSHPGKKVGDKTCYGFLSATDLNTLFSSKSLCMGLVTDQFFLACKHSSSPPSLSSQQQQVLDQINFKYYNKAELDPLMIEKLGIVLYQSEISKQLERLS